MYFQNFYERAMINPQAGMPDGLSMLPYTFPENAITVLEISKTNISSKKVWKLRSEHDTEIWRVSFTEDPLNQEHKDYHKHILMDTRGHFYDHIPDNYFDCIIIKECIEYIENINDFLTTLNHKLKSHGRLLCSYPNYNHWSHILSLIYGYLPHKSKNFISKETRNILRLAELSHIFAKAGFQLSSNIPTISIASNIPQKLSQWFQTLGIQEIQGNDWIQIGMVFTKADKYQGPENNITEDEQKSIHQEISLNEKLLSDIIHHSQGSILLLTLNDSLSESFTNQIVNANIPIAYSLHDLDTITASNKKFDRILSFDFLNKTFMNQHLKESLELLLSDQGEILFIQKNPSYWQNIIKLSMSGTKISNRMSIFRENSFIYDPNTLQTTLQNEGFLVEKYDYQKESNSKIYESLSILEGLTQLSKEQLSKHLLTNRYILSARKKSRESRIHPPATFIYLLDPQYSVSESIEKTLPFIPKGSEFIILQNNPEGLEDLARICDNFKEIKVQQVLYHSNNMLESFKKALSMASHECCMILSSNLDIASSEFMSLIEYAQQSNENIFLPILHHELENHYKSFVPKWVCGEWTLQELEQLLQQVYLGKHAIYSGLGQSCFAVKTDILKEILNHMTSLTQHLWSIEIFQEFKARKLSILKSFSCILNEVHPEKCPIHSKIKFRSEYFNDSETVYNKLKLKYDDQNFLKLLDTYEAINIFQVKSHWEELFRRECQKENKEIPLSLLPKTESYIGDRISTGVPL